MRRIAFIILITFALAVPAFANPILLAPSGTTLTTGQVRAEAALSSGNDDGRYYWLSAGLLRLEVNATRFEDPSGEKETWVGAQWNFLPETILTPAIGFGVTDIASESEEGVGVYVAATRHLPIGLASKFLKEFSVTAGIGAGGISGPFAGFEMRLPFNLFAQGEYDSHDFNAAVGWQPIEQFRLKAYTIRDDYYFGAELLPISF